MEAAAVPPARDPQQSIAYAEVAARFAVTIHDVRHAVRNGQLPLGIKETDIQAAQRDCPRWLTDALANPALTSPPPLPSAPPESKKAQLARRRAAQQARQAEQARLQAPVKVADFAAELDIPKVAAGNLVVVLKADLGREQLTRSDLDQIKAVSGEALAARLADAKLRAPAVRAAAKVAREQRRAELAARREAARQAREVAQRAREAEAARIQRLHDLRAEYDIEPANYPHEVRVIAAAALLGLSSAQVRTLFNNGKLRGDKREVRTSYGHAERIYLNLESLIAAHRDQPDWLTAAKKRATPAAKREAEEHRADVASGYSYQARSERERQKAKIAELQQRHEREQELARARERIIVNTRLRRVAPETVTVHVGPTNSGKTHQALQALAQAGSGTYAAPLRFLAREAHERLSAQLGEERVGLITGEERVNETAEVLCTTAEMAPLSGHLLVLDETHWAADPERGSAWARLLACGEYEHVHLAGAPDALPLLQAAFPDAEIVVHERLSPLTFVGQRHLGKLEGGSAVVAFSRKAVLGLASSLSDRGRSVAALYGAMPVQARRQELERFASGQADILCTTDAIGHGVNVPTLRTVVFAETAKFDGRQRRNLQSWEIAQIAGRAGRFGLTDDGQVAVLSGSKFFSPDAALVQRSLKATVDVGAGLRGHRAVRTGILRPRLSELHCGSAAELALSIEAWKQLAAREFKAPWLRVDDCAPMLAWHQHLAADQLAALDVSDAWSLIRAPADTDKHAALFTSMVRCVLGRSAGARALRELVEIDPRRLWLEEAESLASALAVLRWFTHAFGERCPVSAEQAAEAEAQVGARVSELLAATIRNGDIGRCESCGGQCAPWFSRCDNCHRSRHHSWDEDDYDDRW